MAGIRVSATTNDAAKANDTVRAWSLNSCPAMPSTKISGTNTAMVVRVEAIIAPETSFVPSLAAESLAADATPSPATASSLADAFSFL